MRFLLLFSLIFTIYLNATTIKDIKFDGLIHISPQVAKEMLGFKVGDEIDTKKIDKSIIRFFNQKYFKDITVDEKDGILTYHFIEKPTIAQVEIKGYSDDKKKDIKNIISVKKGDIYNENSIKASKNQILQYLEQKGFYDSIVETKITKLNKNSIKLTFSISKGEKITITNIHLYGSKDITYSDIKSNIVNRQKQFLGWLWGRDDGGLKVDQLKYDSSRIRDYYMRKGYLDAVVSTPFLRTYFEDYTADLSYDIKPGVIYKIESVKIKLAKPVIKTSKLMDELKLRAGRTFNIEKLRKDLKSIEHKVANLGYAYVKVYPDIKQNRKKHTAKIIYNVIPGQIVYISDVEISGNTRTIDRVVRRSVFLSPGDKYSYRDFQDSITSLKKTGYFQDVQITKKRVSNDKIKLLVKVKEAQTGSITGGIGYGSYDGILLSASVSDKNVFGSGINMSVNIDYSSKSLKGSISFFNPRVFDSLYSLGGSIYNNNNDYYAYTEDKKGANLNVGKQFTRHISGSVGYTLENTKLSDLDASLDPILYPEETTLKSAVTISAKYDTTDAYYLPRHGMEAIASMEYAGIGGDDKYLKNYYKFSYFYGLEDLIDYDMILRYKAQLKLAFDNGYLPINEKIYMGGLTTVRGYESNSLSPENSAGTLIGGKRMFCNSIEASIPLVESMKMRGLLFLDYGFTGDDSFDISRGGTGLGIEWTSPLGAIQLIFATPINDKPGDKTSSFEFSMGRRF